MKRRVVVTGFGVVTSVSCEVEDLWNRILAGESGVHPVRLFDISEFKVKIAGDIYDWDPQRAIFPPRKSSGRSLHPVRAGGRDGRRRGLWTRLRRTRITSRCGVILGSGIGGLGEIEAQMIASDDQRT